MEFNISVINVEKTTKTSSNGKPYVQLELAYKDLAQGKVASKKIMPFGATASVHKTLSDASNGNVFTVKSIKNETSGYWDWVEVKQGSPGAEMTNTKATATPKSTYETPEERAKKQVYIVKQSSLSAAIQLLSVGAKTPPDAAAVLSTAQKFTDWVFANGFEQAPAPDLFDGSMDDLPQ